MSSSANPQALQQALARIERGTPANGAAGVGQTRNGMIAKPNGTRRANIADPNTPINVGSLHSFIEQISMTVQSLTGKGYQPPVSE